MRGPKPPIRPQTHAPSTPKPPHPNTAIPGAVAALLGAVLLAGCGSGLKTGGAAVAPTASNAGVVAPGATLYGKTYGEWSAEWWQWAYSIPKSASPLLDPTGEKCEVGQSGPVWFLSGPLGEAVERSCTIPAGKAILFPIINAANFMPVDATTPEGLRAIAKDFMDHVIGLEASVDGTALQGLRNYRFQSPTTFIFTGPATEEEALYPGASGTHEAVADGFWILLEPLSAGAHTLHFRGKLLLPAVYPNVQVFETAATYHLTVQ